MGAGCQQRGASRLQNLLRPAWTIVPSVPLGHALPTGSTEGHKLVFVNQVQPRPRDAVCLSGAPTSVRGAATSSEPRGEGKALQIPGPARRDLKSNLLRSAVLNLQPPRSRERATEAGGAAEASDLQTTGPALPRPSSIENLLNGGSGLVKSCSVAERYLPPDLRGFESLY